MPTERFYKLQDEKRKVIKNALVQEFSRVTFDKVSINQIVQAANISRGSFYTYFQDKQDALFFVFEDTIEQLQKQSETLLKQAQGDFWIMIHDMLGCYMEVCRSNSLFEVARNLLAEGRFLDFTPPSCREGMPINQYEWIKRLYEKTDLTRLKVNSVRDFFILFSACTDCLGATMVQTVKLGRTNEETSEAYHKKIDLIRYGAEKLMI